MTDISPRIVDGEPRCDGDRCDQYRISCGFITRKDNDCIPALRRQRDEALKERDDARRAHCRVIAIGETIHGYPSDDFIVEIAKNEYGAAGAERLFPKEGGTK